jgi:hypothetical protein
MTKVTIAIASLLAFTACKKSDDSKPATTGSSPSSTPTKTAEPAKAGCAADYTKNEAGGFCFKLAAGFKPRPEQKMGSTTMYSYEDDASGVSFSVAKFEDYGFKSQLDQVKRAAEAGKGVETGDVPGGGKFWIYDDAEGNRWSVSVSHGAMTINCSTRVGTASTADNKQAVLDQCKTVTPL